MEDFSCEQLIALLDDYIDGLLTEQKVGFHVRNHLLTCSDCRYLYMCLTDSDSNLMQITPKENRYKLALESLESFIAENTQKKMRRAKIISLFDGCHSIANFEDKKDKAKSFGLLVGGYSYRAAASSDDKNEHQHVYETIDGLTFPSYSINVNFYKRFDDETPPVVYIEAHSDLLAQQIENVDVCLIHIWKHDNFGKVEFSSTGRGEDSYAVFELSGLEQYIKKTSGCELNYSHFRQYCKILIDLSSIEGKQ